jgi:hypothetical protein
MDADADVITLAGFVRFSVAATNAPPISAIRQALWRSVVTSGNDAVLLYNDGSDLPPHAVRILANCHSYVHVVFVFVHNLPFLKVETQVAIGDYRSRSNHLYVLQGGKDMVLAQRITNLLRSKAVGNWLAKRL